MISNIFDSVLRQCVHNDEALQLAMTLFIGQYERMRIVTEVFKQYENI